MTADVRGASMRVSRFSRRGRGCAALFRCGRRGRGWAAFVCPRICVSEIIRLRNFAGPKLYESARFARLKLYAGKLFARLNIYFFADLCCSKFLCVSGFASMQRVCFFCLFAAFARPTCCALASCVSITFRGRRFCAETFFRAQRSALSTFLAACRPRLKKRANKMMSRDALISGTIKITCQKKRSKL